MNFAILSDTHNNQKGVDWVINYLNQKSIKTILHAGDIVVPEILHQFIDLFDGELHFVFGNNQRQFNEMMSLADLNPKITCYEQTMKKVFSGKKIFMNHYTNISLQAAQTGEYDLCIGGHTHVHQVEKFPNSLFINPGNISGDDGTPRNKVSSIVLLDINNLSFEQVIVPNNL